jgi:hypothetical protein
VRDIAMTFDGERKIFRRLVPPLLESSLLGEFIESSVDLDAGETLCAKPKPLLLGRIAIETVAPAFVIPTARTDVCFAGHHSQSHIRGSCVELLFQLSRRTVISQAQYAAKARQVMASSLIALTCDRMRQRVPDLHHGAETTDDLLQTAGDLA